MSRGSNYSLSPSSETWATRREYSGYMQAYIESNQRPFVFPSSLPRRANWDLSGNVQNLDRIYEERAVTVPLGISREMSNMWQRQLVQGSPTEYLGQLDMQTSTLDDSRLTRSQPKRALEKLRKEKYNPIPKSISRRLCLYYRDHALNNYNEKAMQNDEEGKKCAVCLDDFEPKEDVMLTPCNHMFHEDCIVPWVKSGGQCPVCRSAIYEQTKQETLFQY